jgi:hypothetical protein
VLPLFPSNIRPPVRLPYGLVVYLTKSKAQLCRFIGVPIHSVGQLARHRVSQANGGNMKGFLKSLGTTALMAGMLVGVSSAAQAMDRDHDHDRDRDRYEQRYERRGWGYRDHDRDRDGRWNRGNWRDRDYRFRDRDRDDRRHHGNGWYRNHRDRDGDRDRDRD